MGYARAPGKRGVLTFDRTCLDETVTIRSTACLPTDWEPLAMFVGILPTASETPLATGLAGGLSIVMTALALRGFLRLRTTTLAAPCLWAALAGIGLAAGALAEPKFDGIGLSALRFSVAALTLCPLMAVLGAKRPQDRGWQWVVLTLWIVLVWPAVQAVLLPAGVRVELFVAWKLFLWGLISVGLLNYLPTRHWLAALLIAVGQTLLLREHLGWEGRLATTWTGPMSVSLFFLAAILLSWPRQQRSAETRQSTWDGLDTRWRNFRDAYGAFWGLRMLGRINQAAELRAWPMRLDWSGFAPGDRDPTAAEQAELEQALTTTLRRFVAEQHDGNVA